MKTALAILVILLSSGTLRAQKFVRNLPGKRMRDFLTTTRFPDRDAVIILNEQSYVVQPATRLYYGYGTTVPMTSVSRVLLVKVFDNAAAKKYADHEFYFDAYSVTGDKASYKARARVLKPDGEVEVMPANDIKKVAYLKSSDGTPLVYEVIVKIPDVSPGDIIQYEYSHETDDYADPLGRTFGGIFFYNSSALTLYSNLYVTVPISYGTHFYNFPEQRIGKPKVVKRTSSSGETEVTYFWSVTKLRGIPDEPYSIPFDETSFMTAVAGASSSKPVTWKSLAQHFEDKYIATAGNPADELKKLGMKSPGKDTVVSLATADSLYAKLRDYFVLSEAGDLYPEKGDIGDDFDSRKADASDQALIMYGILKHWGVKAYPVWIRDERAGDYPGNVPVLNWFQRMGVLVIVGGKKKLYDFSRSIPTEYETPWFLENAKVMVLADDSCYQWTVSSPGGFSPNLSYERHTLTFTKSGALHDLIIVDYRGRSAEHLRNKFYDSDSESVADYFKDEFDQDVLSKVKNIMVNDFLDQSQFAVELSGESAANTQKIDSLLVVTPEDYTLTRFRKELYSTKRHNGVYLGVPMSFNIEFAISVPPGYAYADTAKNDSLSGPSGSFAYVATHAVGGYVDDVMTVAFPGPYIELSQYKTLISFLDKALSLEKRNIVFKKAGGYTHGK